MPKISIIIPVYQVEKYLTKCIESIIKQTFFNFELILIDDGSTDSSGDICDEYARIDNRIIVIHQKNQGVSAARNKGLDIAGGEYIAFVDADDFIEKDTYDFLYKNLQVNQADISICGLYHYYDENNIIYSKTQICNTLSKEDAIRLVMQGDVISVNPVNKLFARNVINKIRFLNDIAYAEDAYFTIEVLSNSSKIFVDTTPKYYYVHRLGSATTKEFSNNEYQIIDVYKKIFDLINQNFPDLITVAYRRLWGAYKCILGRIASDTIKNRNKYKKDIYLLADVIRKNIFSIIKNSEITLIEKVAYGIIFINPYLFMYVWRKKNGRNKLLR